MTTDMMQLLLDVQRLKLERDVLALEVEKLKARIALLEAVDEKTDA